MKNSDIEGRPPRGTSVWRSADGTRLTVPKLDVPAAFVTYARRCPPSVHKTFLVLLYLAKTSSWFTASYQTIQRHAGYGKRQIIRAIQRLEEDKWIEVYRHRPEGSSLSYVNEYRILFPEIPPQN